MCPIVHNTEEIPMPTEFDGSRLRSAIDDSGKGVTGVHKETGISREQLYKYIRGEDIPSADKLASIAYVTSKPMPYFFAESASSMTHPGGASDRPA
jgi:transcriptional regulator with XRE-family HTH domain